MADITNMFTNPKGLFKFIEAICCLLGAITATQAFLPGTISEHIVIEIALAGGALVALTMLVGYIDANAGNHVSELIFTFTYAVMNIATVIIMIIYIAHNDDEYSRNVGTFLVTGSAVGAAVIFIIDFIKEI